MRHAIESPRRSAPPCIARSRSPLGSPWRSPMGSPLKSPLGSPWRSRRGDAELEIAGDLELEGREAGEVRRARISQISASLRDRPSPPPPLSAPPPLSTPPPGEWARFRGDWARFRARLGGCAWPRSDRGEVPSRLSRMPGDLSGDMPGGTPGEVPRRGERLCIVCILARSEGSPATRHSSSTCRHIGLQ